MTTSTAAAAAGGTHMHAMHSRFSSVWKIIALIILLDYALVVKTRLHGIIPSITIEIVIATPSNDDDNTTTTATIIQQDATTTTTSTSNATVTAAGMITSSDGGGSGSLRGGDSSTTVVASSTTDNNNSTFNNQTKDDDNTKITTTTTTAMQSMSNTATATHTTSSTTTAIQATNTNEDDDNARIVYLSTSNGTGSLSYLRDNVHSVARKLARAYPRAPPKDAWCNTNNNNNNYMWLDKRGGGKAAGAVSGLLYTKVPKAASSTVAGVVGRIARKQREFQVCPHQNDHCLAREKYKGRDKNSTFLIGSVRHPSKRAMSRVYFLQVTRRGMIPTPANIVRALHESHLKGNHGGGNTIDPRVLGFQLGYLSMEEPPPRGDRWSSVYCKWYQTKKCHQSGYHKSSHFAWINETTATLQSLARVRSRVARVMQDYDFITVAERMDESLVVLHFLLGAELGDLVVMDSKVSAGSYFYAHNSCTKIVTAPKTMDPEIEQYLQSSAWYGINYGDFLLHEAASASLDRTIDESPAIGGRANFEQKLREFRNLKSRAQQECAAEAVYRCDSNGVVANKRDTNCYKRDEGCGYDCVDRVIAENANANANAASATAAASTNATASTTAAAQQQST